MFFWFQVNSVNILADVGPEEEVDLELDEDQIYKILAAEDQKRRLKSGSRPDLNSEFDDFSKERSILSEIYRADEQEKEEQMEEIVRENDALIQRLNSDMFIDNFIGDEDDDTEREGDTERVGDTEIVDKIINNYITDVDREGGGEGDTFWFEDFK